MIWKPWAEIKGVQLKLAASIDYHTIEKLRGVLRDIAAEEKPTSNATVRRMANMAREALKA